MQKSDSIAALTKALAAVQKELKPAAKDADNPFFKSKYADLNSVWDACRDLLTKNGLAVIQGNSVGLDGSVIVETILSHESGEWIQSELALPLAKHDPQNVGSAVTYGRRYGLAAIVGIVADVDDDGNHASGRTNGGNGQSAPAPVRQSAPKPSGNGKAKPAVGKARDEKDLASQGHAALIGKHAMAKGSTADAVAREYFSDVQGVGDLSRAAALYIIEELQGEKQ